MITKFPTYYKDFKCVAGDCVDTCCAGWQVVVDSDTANFYNNLNNHFGNEICKVMYTDQDGDVVFKNINNRCPFLNKDNLCDIYINVGEEHLCRTCTMFPRFVATFGGSREMGLSLSCPVANYLILNDNHLDFLTEFDDEMPDINNLDADRFIYLKTLRDKLLDFIKSNASLKSKLSVLVDVAFRLQDNNREEVGYNSNLEINFDFNVFKNLEYLTVQSRELITNLNFNLELNLTSQYNNLLFYYVYRYMLKSIYDDDTPESLLFAVFSIVAIANIEASGNSLSYASRVYSKEVEHSESNLNSIKEYLSTLKYPRC